MTGVRQWVTANRLQVAVTVLLALLLGAATWSSSKASGYWQQATRQDGRSTTLRVESVRFVYQSELPLAIGLGQAQVRSDALRDLGAGTDPEVVGELAAADQLVGQLRQSTAQTTNGLVNGSSYATPDGGYDVPRRVGDVLRDDQVTAYDQSAATMRVGDWWARRARGLALLALVVAAAYVVLSAIRSRRRRRKTQDPPDVGLVPTPWTEPPTGRMVAVLALAAWLALPVLTAEQLSLSMDAARSAAQSSRLISELSGSTIVSQVRDGASKELQLRAYDLSMTGLSRQYAATLDGSNGQQLIGEAEETAGERWAQIGNDMADVPTTADGVDALTIRWLASEPSDWKAIGSRQERTQIDSEDAGSASDAVGLGLLLAALAATAATVARLPRARRRSTSLLAAGLLAAATLVALGGVFT